MCSFQESWPELGVEEPQGAPNHLECIPQLNPCSWKSPGLSQGHVHPNGARAPAGTSEGQERQGRAAPKANLFTAQPI